MIKLHEAIKAINPQAEFTYNEEDFSTIKWLGGTSAISQSDVEAKQAELQTAYDAKEYQRTRANEYLELKEQLDLLYHDMTAGKLDNTGEWHKHIKKIKDDNPKG